MHKKIRDVFLAEKLKPCGMQLGRQGLSKLKTIEYKSFVFCPMAVFFAHWQLWPWQLVKKTPKSSDRYD